MTDGHEARAPDPRCDALALDQIVAGVQEKLLAPLPAADRAQLIGLLTRPLEHDAQP